MEIVVGKTAGFCYGVKRAIDNTEKELKKNKKMYCLGEIVHNSVVTNNLRNKGLQIIENIKEAEDKVIIRAHGVAKEVYEYANTNNIEVKDYTCPKVARIHDIVKQYVEKGYYIFLCGSKLHPENIGTMSHCKNQYFNIEKFEDVNKSVVELKKTSINKILLIAQTTYSIKLFEEIQTELKSILEDNYELKIENTICKATEIRQKETEKLAQETDMMIVIGGKNSSNTKKIYEIAKSRLKNSVCVENVLELQKSDVNNIIKAGKVGIMAGASTPKESIEEVVEYIKKLEV